MGQLGAMYQCLYALLFCACGVQTIERGYQVSVAAQLVGAMDAALCITAVELRACGGETPSRSFAHTASSPTHSGEPHVVREGAPETLATLEPAPGRYCELILYIGPADTDAVNVDTAMVGQSLGIGSNQADGSTSIVMTLEPLILDEDRDVSLHIDFDTSLWLNGVDAALLSAVSERTKLYSNVGMSASLRR